MHFSLLVMDNPYEYDKRSFTIFFCMFFFINMCLLYKVQGTFCPTLLRALGRAMFPSERRTRGDEQAGAVQGSKVC